MMGETSPEVWGALLQESPAPEMTVEASYACLKIAPCATWESIELARREMVQLAHPERLIALSYNEGQRVPTQARRANAASALILRCRTARNQTPPI